MSVQRILAFRSRNSDPAVIEYKVQWDPSWVDASAVRGVVVEEWHDAQVGHQTFAYRGAREDLWTVLKDAHKIENDSEEAHWAIWCAILRNVIEETKEL